MFLSRKKGAALKPLAVLRIVKKAAVGAGIELPVSPHWFRHAHASHALDRGAPIHLSRPLLAMPASIRPAAISMFAPTTAPAAFSLCN